MRAVAALTALLPWSWLGAIGAAVGLLAGSLLRIRRAQVERSLRDAGLAGAPVIARRMYMSLGTGLCELLWLAGRAPEALDVRFEMSPRAALALRSVATRGLGVVVATAHTGNWDLTACAAARWLAREPRPTSLTVVTKRLSWRALDRYWQRLRADRGVCLVDAHGATSAVREALGARGVVALLVDQAPERTSGVAPLPFFGRSAKHDLAPAILAAKARVPILVMVGRRRADGRHELDVIASIEPEELRGPGATLRATARISAAVEAFVRACPEQWLWLHRRWK